MRQLGIPGQHIQTLSYVDSRLATVPVVEGNRRPLTTDKRHPLWTEWRVKKNAVDASEEGEFWKLIRHESNGDATWIRICEDGDDGSVFWEYTADASQQAVENRGYICDNATGVDVALPTSAELGSLLSLTAEQGKWKLEQGAGQSVIFGDHQTTVGVTGYLESTAVGDSITLVCTEEDTTWQAVDGSIGNISIDGTVQNNALNQYSEYFSVGPDSEGTAATTFPLAVQEDANSPSGITVKNDNNGTGSAAVTNYQTDSGSVQSSIGTYGPNYITSPNLAGRSVLSCAGDSCDGISLRYNTGGNLLVLNADSIAATFDSDGVMTEHVALEVGPDSEGTTATNRQLSVVENHDAGTGIGVVNSSSVDGASATIYLNSDNVGGSLTAFNRAYSTVPEFAGKVVLNEGASDSDGIVINYANASNEFQITRGASEMAVVDGDGILTVHKAMQTGADVDGSSDGAGEFTVSDGTTGMRSFVSNDSRNSLNALTVRNDYENGITSGARVSVSTGVSEEDSRVSGGIGAHSPNYTSVNNFADRVSLYCDVTGLGLGIAYPTSKNLIMGATNTSSVFFTMTGAGERTMPLNPCFLAKNISVLSNVTGNAVTYTVPFATEVFDQGSDYNNSTYTFTAPVTGKYLFNSAVYLTDLISTHTAITFDCVTSNGTHRLLTTGAYSLRAQDNASGNYQLRASCIADMDAGDTAYMSIKVVGGTQTVDISNNANNATSFSGNLIS